MGLKPGFRFTWNPIPSDCSDFTPKGEITTIRGDLVYVTWFNRPHNEAWHDYFDIRHFIASIEESSDLAKILYCNE